MLQSNHISLAELCGSLSYALDLTEGQPAGHCIRTTWIAYHTGQAAGLDAAMLRDVYYTALLKDLGCSSNAARICDLYLTDDIKLKSEFKLMGTGLGPALKFVLQRTGTEAGLKQRLGAILNILQNGGQITVGLIETRCQRGADIAARMRFSETVQGGIRALDEHFDGGGKPYGIGGGDLPLNANLALLGQVADVFHEVLGPEGAVAELRSRSGSWFDPALFDAFLRAQATAGFWSALTDEALPVRVFALPPGQGTTLIDEDYLDDIAEAFADVIDAKSSFTADHSDRVTQYTDLIAEELGFTPERRRWLRRAALLHDLGKLAVSNTILDKPNKLDDTEWQSVRSHPGIGRAILEQISVFSDIAPLAGGHHERLDGRGYPDGLKGEEVTLEMRILAVADVFDALSADRPYRAAMSTEEALAILDNGVGTAFDAHCVDALKRGLARLTDDAAAPAPLAAVA
ncbi:MAG: metal-dependent phosphohydrolase [Rhizobiales bacterium]|nr:metal-dependent phosphohydrolase [Hyphomicrobiales bacterium]